jgi:hypothetical protein
MIINVIIIPEIQRRLYLRAAWGTLWLACSVDCPPHQGQTTVADTCLLPSDAYIDAQWVDRETMIHFWVQKHKRETF